MSVARPITAAVLASCLVVAGCGLPGVTPAGSPIPAGDGQANAEAGLALPPAWTDTPSPTTAPPTITPTATPPFGLEWATPVPVETEFDGWVRLESKRATLWLPPGFEVADLGEFGELMALMTYAMTEAMGEMAGELAAAIRFPGSRQADTHTCFA